MVELLKTVVEYETPSHDKAALDKLSGYLAGLFAELGAQVQVFEQAGAGNHLTAAFGEGEQCLICCHFDTVWPMGELKKRPFRIEGNKAFGPGIYDMKGGLVQAIFAVKAIMACGAAVKRRIVFFLNSDEEIGSPTSRALIEAEAKKSSFVLVPECAGPGGSIKLSRSGVGIFDVKTTGKAAHAGNDHAQGVNALEEMAHQIIKLQAITDYGKGTTVSVGEAQGGQARNVVPDFAWAKIDLRATTQQELAAAEAKIMGLTPVLPGATVSVTGSVNRPPLEATPANKALYERAKNIAAKLGFELAAMHVGGGSDGNFTSAVGTPTLDGIGAAGEGAHAVHEYVLLDTMAKRAALVAELLAE